MSGQCVPVSYKQAGLFISLGIFYNCCAEGESRLRVGAICTETTSVLLHSKVSPVDNEVLLSKMPI